MSIPDCDFLNRISILDVWRALGGGPVRRNRACAFWRRGANGWSIAINAGKGVWYDHRDGCGGGILDLVQTALGCDRVGAIEWCRDFAGVPRPEWTAQQKRDYARRRAAAEGAAADLVQWRERMTDAVREYRDLNLHLYHVCKTSIIHSCYDGDPELAALMGEADAAEGEWERAECALGIWRSATWDSVLRLYRNHRRAA